MLFLEGKLKAIRLPLGSKRYLFLDSPSIFCGINVKRKQKRAAIISDVIAVLLREDGQQPFVASVLRLAD